MSLGVRLPLQIGTTSLWGMTRSALLLVPGVILLPFGLIGGVGVLYAGDGGDVAIGIASFLITVPIVMIWAALRQLGRMLRARPSDAVLDADGLRVEGGPHGGIHLTWAQLRAGRCELREVIVGAEAGARGSGTAMTHLVAAREGHAELVLAEAEAPEERASLAALHASIEAARGDESEAEALEITGEVVRCAACGAAVVPGPEAHVQCHRCETMVEMPAGMRQRVEAATQGKAAREQAARLVRKLIAQPGALRINLAFVIGGVVMLLAWPTSLGLGIHEFVGGEPRFGQVMTLLVFPLALIPGLYALLRMTLVDRFALRLLTLDMGARAPVRVGDPYGCHACGGPLVVGKDEVVVRCVYCGADNVLGLDLRVKAGRERAAARSLGEALAWRSRERLRWRWRMMPALGLTALGGYLLWSSVRAPDPSHVLATEGRALEAVTRSRRDERMPAVGPDGKLVVVRDLEDPRVVNDLGESRGLGAWPAWDGVGQLLAVRGGQVLRIEARGYDPKQMFGLGVVRVAGSGVLGVSLEGGLVGAASVEELGSSAEDGGRVRAATAGRDAAYSPVTRRLAFVREVDGVAQVFSTGIDSPGWRQWTSDAGDKSQPAWSPDGRRLVWVVDVGTAEDPQKNLVIGADDGSPAVVLTTGDADPSEPSWAADGRVYFAADVFGQHDVFRVDPGAVELGERIDEVPVLRPGPAATEVERVTDDARAEHDPVLSPDGATLAFARTRAHEGRVVHMGVVRWDAATRTERVLARDDGSEASLQWARSPTWDPDGTLVYVLADEPVTLRRGAEVLMTANPGGSLVRPRVSPDGTKIVVERRASAGAAWELVLRAEDGSLTVLGPGTWAAWRADGALAFVRDGELMLTPTDNLSSATRVEIGDVEVRGVAVDLNGRWILEVGRGPEQAELVVVGADGKIIKIVEGAGDHGRPSVGRDGRVYFTSDAMGQLDVWRARLR